MDIHLDIHIDITIDIHTNIHVDIYIDILHLERGLCLALVVVQVRDVVVHARHLEVVAAVDVDVHLQRLLCQFQRLLVPGYRHVFRHVSRHTRRHA